MKIYDVSYSIIVCIINFYQLDPFWTHVVLFLPVLTVLRQVCHAKKVLITKLNAIKL